MDPAVAHGLAAAISFVFDLLQVMTLIVIAANWLNLSRDGMVLGVLMYFMDPLLAPFRKITGYRQKGVDWGAVLFIALLIPCQFVIVHSLRNV